MSSRASGRRRSDESRGRGLGGVACGMTPPGWFQVSSNFHNKPGESDTETETLDLEDTLGVESRCFRFRNWPDEKSKLDFPQETMHWEQFVRLTNGKVSLHTAFIYMSRRVWFKPFHKT